MDPAGDRRPAGEDEDRDLPASGVVGVDVERVELDDRVEPQEATRADDRQIDPDLDVGANLERVRRDCEVARRAEAERARDVEREADPLLRRDRGRAGD